MLYEKLREVAESKNITMYRIEKDLELSNGSLSKWKTSIPSAKTLKKVSDYLEVDLRDFI